MGSSIRLGKVFGIPVGISYSWFVIFALITYSLVNWSDQFTGWPTAARWGGAIVTSLLFFASVLAHELAHALLARKHGIPVKEITLFFFGGVSQITEEAKKPSSEFLVGGVGPLLSLVLGGAFVGLYFVINPMNERIALIPKWIGFVNLMLAVFNLVPGFPLDGGRILRAIVWAATGNYYKATRVATITGRVVGMLMIVGGIVLALQSGNLVTGVWIALIGWFLTSAASSHGQQLKLRESLVGRSARDLMDFNCPTVPSQMTVSSLVDDFIVPTGQRLFAVGDLASPQGVISVREIRFLNRKDWATTQVATAMQPMEKVKTVEPGEDAFHVLEVMEQAEISEIPVKYDGRIVGVINRESVLRFLRTHAALGM